MKIKVLYYELKEKEFRSKKTLENFMKTKLTYEIVGAYQIIGKINYKLMLTEEGFQGVHDVRNRK